MSGRRQSIADEETFSDIAGGKEYVFKVVVVGSYNVGKTTFIKRLLHTRLPSHPSNDDHTDNDDDDPDEIPVAPTVGTDFYSRVVHNVLPGTNVRLQLWDTAGLARYAAVNETTYRNASLVVCLFDVSSPSSLEEVTERHLAQAAEFIPDLEQEGIFVIAGKVDLLAAGQEGARARSQQRAAAPEAAFMTSQKKRNNHHPGSRGRNSHEAEEGDGGEDDGHSSVQLTSSGQSSTHAAPSAAVVSVKDVQECVLDLFVEVHYAEVSASTRGGMSEVLERICQALLRNEGVALPTDSGRRREDLSFDIAAESQLPLVSALQEEEEARDNTHHNSSSHRDDATVSNQQKSSLYRSVPDTNAFTKPPSPSQTYLDTNLSPNSLDEDPPVVSETALREGCKASIVPAIAATAGTSSESNSTPGASWRNAGLTFDLGARPATPPPFNQLAETAIFSPSSMPPSPAAGKDNQDDNVQTLSDHGGIFRPPSGTGPAAKHADPCTTTAAAAGPKARARPNPNETRDERAAREKAEMAALLGKKPAATGGATAKDRFLDADLDTAEHKGPSRDAGDNNTVEGKGGGGRKFHSVLDDAAEEQEHKRKAVAADVSEDGGDDGRGFRGTLDDRYSEIERDAADKATAAKRAAKRGQPPEAEAPAKAGKSVTDMYKKKKTKTKGKCNCAVM